MGIIKKNNPNTQADYSFAVKRFLATLIMLVLALGAYLYIEYNYHINFEETTQSQL